MLFAIGTLWFWVLLGIVTIVLFAAVEAERVGFATLAMIAFFGLLSWQGDFSLVGSAAEHPGLAVLAALGYLAVGALWSVGKWWFYVKGLRRKLIDAKERFCRDNGIVWQGPERTPIPDAKREDWERVIGYSGLKKPSVGRNRWRIMSWMAYWPWSMTWTVINDPVRKIFRRIFDRLRAVYQRIADSAYKGFDEADPANVPNRRVAVAYKDPDDAKDDDIDASAT